MKRKIDQSVRQTKNSDNALLISAAALLLSIFTLLVLPSEPALFEHGQEANDIWHKKVAPKFFGAMFIGAIALVVLLIRLFYIYGKNKNQNV